jgi:RHS repeat-associated protein
MLRAEGGSKGFRPGALLGSVAGTVCLVFFLALGASSAVAAECTNTWVGPAEGSWKKVANWSAGHVPTSTEVACIGAGNTAKVNEASAVAAVVQGEGNVSIWGYTLELTSSTEASSINNLTMTGNATLTGAGSLNISGNLTMPAEGNMKGSGSTVILPGASATISYAGTGHFAKRLLVNEGTFTMTGGSLSGSEGAKFINKGTFNANEKAWAIQAMPFVNEGTFQKTSGTGTVEVTANFENLGTVAAKSGTIKLAGGGTSESSAKWEASKGALVRFYKGPYYIKGGTLAGPISITNSAIPATVTTEGSVEAKAAEIILGESATLTNPSGSLTVSTLTMNGNSTVNGAGTLNISGSFNMPEEGNMKGSGSTVILPGATATLSYPGTGHFQQRQLLNEGTFTMTGGSMLGGEGSKFTNKGTFNANEKASSVKSMPFVNEGTFQKTSGTGTVELSANFENLGTVAAKSGTIKVAGGGSSEGASVWEASKGAQVRFYKGPYYIKAGTLAGPVSVTNSAIPATLTVEGAVEAKAAEFSISESGTLSLPSGSLTVTSLTFAGAGNLTGAGTLDISGSLGWGIEGAMKGTGSTVILPGATATVSFAATAQLEQRQLVNEGTLTHSSGQIAGSAGGKIINKGTYNANGGTVAAPVLNTGTFRKASGTGNNAVSAFFENAGTVAAQSGTLSFSGGGISEGSNAWNGEGAELKFIKGTYLLTGGSISGSIVVTSSITGATVSTAGVDGKAGNLTVSASGNLEVLSGSMTINSLALKNANVKGAGTLNISSSLSWTEGGSMTGSGSTVILPGATATVAPVSNTVSIQQRQFVNEGVLTHSTGQISESEGALIINKGTFNANSEPNSIVAGSGESLFVNSGTFRKTAGTGTSKVSPNFENLGTIKQESGKLSITKPVSVGFRQRFGKRCHAGDPVECATGDFVEGQTDFSIGGLGIGLNLTRSYSAKAAATASAPGAFGYGWSNSFSDRLVSEEGGKKVTLFTGSGSSVPFTGGPSTFTTPAWSQYSLSGSAEAGYTLTLPERIEYSFSGTGRLESISDRAGNETALTYNGSGQLEKITDPAGRQITLAYNGEGLVESAKDPMGNMVQYAYESKNLKSVTLPGEESPRWQFKYDTSHRITSMTDGRGGKTTNEYDSSNRVISQTDPAGHTLTFEYEAFHTRITNKATGSVTDEWFTSNNQPYSITRGFGTAAATTESFSYDSGGRLIAATNGKGHTTTYGYNGQGDRTSEKDAEGHETKWTYNAAHELISTTTPSGETTTIERDANGNVESISRPGPEEATQTTSFEHDEDGQLESLTDPLGRTWTYGYNSQGDRVSEADPLGNTQTLGYDKDSRLTSLVTPRGNEEGAEAAEFTTTIERDPQGRPLKATDPLGGSVEYDYDANGNLEAKTNANGHTTKYAYNANNQQIKVEKPNGAVLETEYDGEGGVTTQTDGNEKTTTYIRNALGQPVEVVDPLGRKTVEEFDAAGNLKAVIDPAERKTSYVYDKAGRLIEVDYSDPATSDTGLEYDANGNVTKMIDGTGESTFLYDELGRLTEAEDGHGDAIDYSYDLAEQLTGLVYPNGKSISRTFDKAGRLATVTDWLAGTTTFAYDANSNLEAVIFPIASGNVDEYTYDNANRMSAAKFTSGPEALASLSYVRDAAGQIEEEAVSGLPGSAEVLYGYDENERLIEAGEASFGYDAADNLTKAPGTTNTYDAAAQLETGTGITYTYNQLGQRTKATPEAGSATSYEYDQAGNLISVQRPAEGEVPAISQTFAYDGAGLLASKTSSLATKYFAWDNSGSLPLLLDDGENSYIYGPNGLPIEQVSSEEKPTYLHHDQLGSTRMLTNGAGEETGAFTFTPFGALEANSGTATTPMGFAGQYTDEQSGLQYLRARFYDPGTAQFLSRDPLVGITQAPYGYANGNPLHFTDPTGLACVGSTPIVSGVSLPSIDPVDCATEAISAAPGAAGDAGSLVLDLGSSAVLPVLLSIACVAEPDWCPGLFAGGVGANVGSNAAKEALDPCFSFWSETFNGLLVAAAAALPGGVFGVTAGRYGPKLGPIARRIIQIVLDAPGVALEVVRATTR